MKKLLFSFFSVLSIGAFAQDLGISLTSPANGSTIQAGSQFAFTVDISNNGTTNVTASDTILFAPLIDGSFIITITSQGDTVPVIYLETGTALNAGGNSTFTRNLNLNFGSGLNGQRQFCAIMAAIGPNWNGVTQTDTTNDMSCNTVTFNSGTVGFDDHFVVVENVDASYASGKTFHARLQGITGSNVTIEVYNLQGQLVKSVSEQVNTEGKLTEDYNMNKLNTGIYIVKIATDGKAIGTHKIILE